MAEVIAVLVLFFGVGCVLLDLGRPDRAFFVIRHAHFTSPLIWDVTSISIYLLASMIYLYLPLIPDIAILREISHGWRHTFYRILALGWQGTARQKHVLERLITIMSIIVVPMAIFVHTVLAFVFAMTLQPMWHSSIFGPYFVAGAIFSGVAALITLMVILRKAYHLENYLKPIHFNNMGIILLVMTLFWLYFTSTEYVTTWYGNQPAEMEVFWSKVTGPYAPLFWTMVFACFVLPFTILCNRRTRTITGTLIASISINIGMWIEHFTIVVPTLVKPRWPTHHGVSYWPTWVEISLFTGFFAGFILLYMVFTKLFPIISLWEIQEGRQHAVNAASDRIRQALPDEKPTRMQ